MLKIAIDCRMIGSGGIGSFISELIPYFLEENECLLIGTHEQCMPFLRMQNVEFCFCDVKPFSLKEVFSFPKDVLDAIHHYDFYFTPYCNIPGGIEIPIFSTIHDVVFLDIKELTGFFGRLIRKIFYKRALNYSNAVFTVSEFSKSRIIHHLHCKKTPEVVYNGLQKYLQEDFNAENLTKENQILFVGNIKKHKGLKNLLEAYEIAKSKSKDFNLKLIIVGNSENFRTGDKETVIKLQNLTSDDIEFTGKISNDELKHLYAKSKFLVQPSLYEGFGMPPLEALSVGTQVILSDIPVFKEIYNDLPVIFFKAGDSDDLADKILSFEEKTFSQEESKLIHNKYSYRKSAEKIIEVMANNR